MVQGAAQFWDKSNLIGSSIRDALVPQSWLLSLVLKILKIHHAKIFCGEHGL